MVLEALQALKNFDETYSFKKNIDFIIAPEFQEFTNLLTEILLATPFSQNSDLPRKKIYY
jgi:hypothetical protein